MDSQFADVFLGHPEGELYRPGVLSNAFDTFTHQVFEEAGLHEGMDVLEIGSVNGDVALLAAQFVGASGSVLGIEPSREAVDFATARAADKGVHNVRFVEANIEGDLPFDQKFDALVGRVVLMFLPSPAATLGRLAWNVKPGGVVIFQNNASPLQLPGLVAKLQSVARAGGQLPLVIATDRGLAGLAFADPGQEAAALADMQRRWPAAIYTENAGQTASLAQRVFDPVLWRADRPLNVVLIGTDFEVRVWQTLVRIPMGKATTYSGIAQHIGKPTAARAVGAAVGKNPISFVVPCHRVLGKSGDLTGYHWGLTRKHAMLGWEVGQVSAGH